MQVRMVEQVLAPGVQDGQKADLILISYQDDTNYGMLRVVSDDRRNAWQDLDR